MQTPIEKGDAMAVVIDRKRWCEGRVREVYRWTDRLYSLRVDAAVQPFTAGQFTKLGLVIGDELVSRPYSYVNAPQETPLEFYFVTVPEGPLTNRMTALSPGDSIEVMSRAAGFLTLDEVPDAAHLWMLSTGTAIGPFLSILKTAPPWQRFRRIVLVHAVRLAAELSFSGTIDALRRDHPGRFDFVPVVSREDTDFAFRARVPAIIEDGRLEQRVGLPIDSATSQVMICGNPDMVKATSATLFARGLTRNRRREPGHVSVENYW
jgi:ferredoxin/flavodoxin---NADP+ reductase